MERAAIREAIRGLQGLLGSSRLAPVRLAWKVTAQAPRKRERCWQLRYRPPDGVDPHDGRPGAPGRDYLRSSRLMDEGAARELAAAEEARLNARPRVMFSEIAMAYLGSAEASARAGDLAQRTLANYRQALAAVSWALDGAEPTRASVSAAADRLRARESPLAASTIRLYLGVAKGAWEWALERGLVSDPWPRVKVRSRPTRFRALRPDELQAVLAEARDHHPGVYPILALIAETGARQGETLGLKQRDVDRALGVVYFARRVKGEGSRRPVPVSPELVELLPPGRPGDALFGGLTPRRLLGAWYRILAAVGLSGEPLGGPHSLRRSWISAALGSGVRPDQSMRLAGHSSLRTHLGYAHSTVEEGIREAAETVRGRLTLPHLSSPEAPCADPAPAVAWHPMGTSRAKIPTIAAQGLAAGSSPQVARAMAQVLADDPRPPPRPRARTSKRPGVAPGAALLCRPRNRSVEPLGSACKPKLGSLSTCSACVSLAWGAVFASSSP